MNKLLLKLALMAALFAGYQGISQGDASGPMAKQMPVNGVSLRYIEQGQGAPVVFVHGAFSDLRAWEPQREAVARDYRFIAYTQRYHGTAAWADKGEHYSHATAAADLESFIRGLGVGPVYLVGRSNGAAIAIRMAYQNPELVRAVFVHEPAIVSLVTDPASKQILKQERSGLAPVVKAAKAGHADDATRLFADWTNDQPGEFDALPPETRAMHLDNSRTVALHFAAPPAPAITCADLGRFKPPLAITTGEHTRPFFRTLAETTHRCVPDSQLIKIAGARHAATAQNPAAFNEAMMAFLAQHSSDASPAENLGKLTTPGQP